MGEYAKYGRSEIKIGTCEDMYYLRFDQRNMVSPLEGNVNPQSLAECLQLRFRFPWPDEDNGEPGSFENYCRAVNIPGATMPEGVDHYSVQFVAQAGYLTSLPCPESGNLPPGLSVHRNGFGGAVKLVQQKLLADGRLVPILQCGGCGAKWRLEDQAEIDEIIGLLRAEGQRRKNDTTVVATGEKIGNRWWDEIAARIAIGAKVPLAVTA